jgi:putative membrane protein
VSDILRLALAWIHLVALGFGLGAILDRGAALREPAGSGSIRRAFRDDSVWGIAALLWISSGLWRLFGATEKSTTYYLHNPLFMAKMGLLVVILLLEIWPMITLSRWRRALGRGQPVESVMVPAVARRIAAISTAQALLIIGMVAAAVATARGYGARA